jgi:hypothetical protein
MSDLRVDVVDAHDAVVSRSHAVSERLDELSSTNTELREALRNQEAGVKARVDAVQRLLDAALQHQATLTAQIAMLQGELCIMIAAAESYAAVVAERDAHITLATTQLERALENEAASSLTAAQANLVLVGNIRAFRGLAIQVRPALETMGLELPPIPYESEGNNALWFAEVTGRIDSLLERPRQVLQTEGEYIVNLVGNLILTRVDHFSANFSFTRKIQ